MRTASWSDLAFHFLLLPTWAGNEPEPSMACKWYHQTFWEENFWQFPWWHGMSHSVCERGPYCNQRNVLANEIKKWAESTQIWEEDLHPSEFPALVSKVSFYPHTTKWLLYQCLVLLADLQGKVYLGWPISSHHWHHIQWYCMIRMSQLQAAPHIHQKYRGSCQLQQKLHLFRVWLCCQPPTRGNGQHQWLLGKGQLFHSYHLQRVLQTCGHGQWERCM